MQLYETNNQTVNFEVLAFEFGTSRSKIELDKDWLQIKVDIITTKQSWHVIDPSLTAAEVMRLTDWLYNLACHKPASRDLYFLEPNLSFHHVYDMKGNCTIKIIFNAELKPFWYDKDRECCIICRLTEDQLHTIASGLHDELQCIYTKAGCENMPWPEKSTSRCIAFN